jgi:AhpD family alkylhydroperoxidase
MMPGGILARRETELVILRVAHLRDCTYEWDHHVRLGRRAGLTHADIARVKEGRAEGWSSRQAAILTAVDQLHREQYIDDGAWTALRRYLDDRECIELCMLVGHYEMLATFIGTLHVEPDRELGR